jgi:hypothetical protein
MSITTRSPSPFLVARNTNSPTTKLDIYIQCGIFEANNGNDRECEIPAEFASDQIQVAPETAKAIYRAYQKALTSLAGMTESLANYVRSERLDSEKRYFLAASAAYGDCRNAACMLLAYPGGEEYMLACPDCDEDMYIWPNEFNAAQLIVFKDDPVSTENEDALDIEKKQPNLVKENDWQFLYRQAGLIEDQTMLDHLPYLAGDTECPHCGAHLSIWPELLRNF